jgi:hypothetical protein
VLEPIDPPALAILRPLDATPLEPREASIPAGAHFHAIDASLTSAQPGALAAA